MDLALINANLGLNKAKFENLVEICRFLRSKIHPLILPLSSKTQYSPGKKSFPTPDLELNY